MVLVMRASWLDAPSTRPKGNTASQNVSFGHVDDSISPAEVLGLKVLRFCFSPLLVVLLVVLLYIVLLDLYRVIDRLVLSQEHSDYYDGH